MSEPTLKELAQSLQNSIQKMGTMAAHQAYLLTLLAEEIESPEQDALLFALQSANANGHEWQVEVDRLMSNLTARLEASNVQ